jgi:6-phosphofructokinase 1
MTSVSGEIAAGNARGKVSWIIIVAEGVARAEDVAKAISMNTGLETRIAVLGHIQRGGRPTAVDRILAARLGHQAVEALIEGQSDKCVNIRDGRPELIPLATAIRPKIMDISEDYHLLKVLS